MRSPGGRVRACALAFSTGTCVLFFHVGTGAQAPAAPRYKFDHEYLNGLKK